MKKLFLLLLLLGAAWGFYEGRTGSEAVQPHGRAAAGELSPLDKASSFFDALFAGLSDLSFNAPSVFSEEAAPPEDPPPQDPAGEGSVFAPILEVWNFRESLESRIDRSAFVTGDDIPLLLKQAVVAAEDRRFYEHGAIDLIGVIRAAAVNAAAGETVEGGSTISQQTVKNIFLSGERTMSRKIREFFLAVQLEQNYTKDEILELYLNTIYFGHGAYGVGPACRTYFGKEPADLTLQECAMIAGLPQAPSAYDPIDHPEEAKKRQAVVLMLMAREGYITAQQTSAAAFHVILDE